VGGDTGVGVERLTLTHTATDYTAAVTGIADGTNSAQDNIIGNHVVTVDAVGGTIQLNGGQAVAIGGTANQLLTDGVHTVYVDTTGPLVNGVDTITGNGVLNAGDADVAINFANNQQVITSDGRTVFVDTTTAHQTGTEVVTFTGTVDVFETLIHLRDCLYNTYNEPEPEQLERISGCLDHITQAQDDVLAGAAAMGNRVVRLESTQSRVMSLGLTATESLSKTEDADAAKVIVEMQSEQAALQAALAACSATLKLSLLDYLF